MPPTADDMSRAILHEASEVLDQCVIKIRHCLKQLLPVLVVKRHMDAPRG